MKILFLTHRFYPDIGGIEVNSEILSNAFHTAGEEVRLVTWTQDIKEKRFPFLVIRNPSILQLIKQHRWADVIFENNISLRLAWPSLFLNKPTIIALRTWIARTDGKIGWQDRFKLLWLRRSMAVIAVSKAISQKCWPSAEVIGNPYRVDLFKLSPEVHRSNSFVFMGRLVSDKGVDLAIQAIYGLSQKNLNGISSNLSLTIIGDGPERSLLEKMVQDFKIEDKVIFTGILKGQSLVSNLNKHKYILVPSRWEEPFGNVALEGLACGCIPIVSDKGGLPDAIGKAGLTFQSGNVKALVACMEKLIGNPQLQQQLINYASSHLAAHDPDLVSQKYLEVIKRAVPNKY